MSSHTQPVTRVPTSRLTLSDDLDDLATLHAEVAGDGILLQDTGQLGFLKAVALEQGDLLVPTKDDVARDELVLGYVDEQILLEEPLDGGPLGELGDLLLGGSGDGDMGDEDAGLVVLVGAEAAELAHLLGSQVVLVEELDPDGANVGLRIGILRRSGRGEFLDHLGTWSRRELQFGAAR